jgi:hypothetical protein
MPFDSGIFDRIGIIGIIGITNQYATPNRQSTAPQMTALRVLCLGRE